MTLRCIRCHKPLTRPAAQAGSYAWGPKCARQAGLVERRKRKGRVVVSARVEDEKQMEITFEVTA